MSKGPGTMVPTKDRARISDLGFRQAPQNYALKTASGEIFLQPWMIGLKILIYLLSKESQTMVQNHESVACPFPSMH
jgi:hypothetical protein